ncbi:MAG: murein biosynthesis integral membrane protein MurJ, partial [Verrucomicrobia bacterium]|nr:murein biosynthesis integral membrane protein MurJ [Verrucomicrobiota bacterium]
MADTPQTVRRSSFAFLSGTLISRVSGLGRDVSMAVAFGSHPAIAAFMVAFRFANLMRRLFGEGTLPAGFIPHFEEMRAVSPERGATFFRDLFFSLFTTLTLLVVALEVLLWGLGAWVQWNPDNLEILRLTQWMLPGVIFICLFGLSSGLLQCERRFFLTGFAPVAFNLVWIVAAFFLRKKAPEGAAYSLSVAVVIAFFLQWALLAPQLVTHLRRFLSWKACFAARLFSSELRPLIRPFFLGALGVGAMQLNSALDAVFARAASLEGPAYLWYAIRIEQLPLALFGIALSTALLTPLARAAKAGLRERYFEL